MTVFNVLDRSLASAFTRTIYPLVALLRQIFSIFHFSYYIFFPHSCNKRQEHQSKHTRHQDRMAHALPIATSGAHHYCFIALRRFCYTGDWQYTKEFDQGRMIAIEQVDICIRFSGLSAQANIHLICRRHTEVRRACDIAPRRNGCRRLNWREGRVCCCCILAKQTS